MRKIQSLVLSLLLVCSLFALPGLAADDGEDEYVTDIAADHDLDTVDAISTFNSEGQVETDLTRIDMTVTIADEKSDVGASGRMLPTDTANDFLRLQYNEDAERTVRILIPEEYWEPYLQEDVESITSPHTADYKTSRGGEYTAVIITFDGPADVVLPAKWVDSTSYKALERVDQRLEKSVGITVRDDGSEWTYVESEDLVSGPGYEIGEKSGDVTVQLDATPDSPEETWINAAEGETMGEDIYYYQRDSENGSTYIVSKTDNPPAVRYKVDSTFMDRIRGDIRDITLIPSRLKDTINGGGLFG